MRGNATPEKLAALSALGKCFAVAKSLYDADPERYKPVYSWINAKVNQRRDLTLALAALTSLKKRCDYHNPPAGEVFGYLEGTLKKIEEQAEAGALRRQRGFEQLGEIRLNLKQLAQRRQGRQG